MVGSSLQRGLERPFKVRSNIPLTDRLPNPQPERLKGSKFGSSEGLTLFAQKFDEGVKRVFSDDQVPQSVKFGSPWDNDSNAGIRAGGLTLTG